MKITIDSIKISGDTEALATISPAVLETIIQTTLLPVIEAAVGE